MNRRYYLAGLVLEGAYCLRLRDILSGLSLLFLQFVLVDRRKKIESGERTTSFSWMLNDKRGVIGRMLGHIPQRYRELSFMTGQLGECSFVVKVTLLNERIAVYTMVVELPVLKLYQSPFWSATFLLAIFSVSVWNGGGFYIEVFGRKYAKLICHIFLNLITDTSCKVRTRTRSFAQGAS